MAPNTNTWNDRILLDFVNSLAFGWRPWVGRRPIIVAKTGSIGINISQQATLRLPFDLARDLASRDYGFDGHTDAPIKFWREPLVRRARLVADTWKSADAQTKSSQQACANVMEVFINRLSQYSWAF